MHLLNLILQYYGRGLFFSNLLLLDFKVLLVNGDSSTDAINIFVELTTSVGSIKNDYFLNCHYCYVLSAYATIQMDLVLLLQFQAVSSFPYIISRDKYCK